MEIKEHNRYIPGLTFTVAIFLFIGGLINVFADDAAKTVTEITGKYSNENMVFISSSDHPFYIDKFEVSMPYNGEYFSVVNQTPAVNVSQEDALGYCSERKKRLCTVKEWESACLGIHYLEYSYGNTVVPGLCNIENVTKGSAFTGQFSHCKSEYHVHDMIGNVMEITADKNEGGLVIAKGGDYSSTGATCFTKFYFAGEQKNSKLGFRCCKDVEQK
jgi:formylglycine-generating enzyme required for sulfatase activity